MFYKAILGDGEDYGNLSEATPEFEEFFFIIYFILTVFFIVIMLNLLIAIISETFNKVTSVESKAFQYERLNIIIEYEEVMSKAEKDRISKELEGNFLYIVHAHETTNEEAELLKERKNLKQEQFLKMYSDIGDNSKTIKTLNDNDKIIQENIEKLQKDYKADFESLNKSMADLTEKITNDVTERIKSEMSEKLAAMSQDLKTFIQSQQVPKEEIPPPSKKKK